MIYLDNSATTNLKPFCVKMATLKGLNKKYSANASRGGYDLSINAGLIKEEAREALNNMVNNPNGNVIFTSGCTEALNLAILGTVKKGGHVITTIYEHNSVLRPLFKLQKDGLITLSILKPQNEKILVKQIQNEIKNNTYMVAINHTSNVTGTTQDIKEIGKLCKDNKLLFLVDAAQSLGHSKINMEEMNINMLAVAGHKGLYAPQGIGALIVNNVSLSPFKYGGTGTNSISSDQPTDIPDGFEVGTGSMPLVMGLNAGINFVNKNQSKINNKTKALSQLLINELLKIKEVKLYTNKNCCSGVVSFNVKGFTSNEVSDILNQDYKICIRSGLHCAPLVHKHFGTLNTGMVRASIAINNKKADILKLISAIKQIIQTG